VDPGIVKSWGWRSAYPVRGERKHGYTVAVLECRVQRSGNGVSRYNWQSREQSAKRRGWSK